MRRDGNRVDCPGRVRRRIFLPDDHLVGRELIGTASYTAATKLDDDNDGQQQRPAALACFATTVLPLSGENDRPAFQPCDEISPLIRCTG
jgi:hypothetical protein